MKRKNKLETLRRVANPCGVSKPKFCLWFLIMLSKEDIGMCYDHTHALGDNNPTNDATLYYCDTTPNVPCGTDYQNQAASVTNWKKTTTGSHGLQTLYEAVGR
jgi:hypothetical protein